MPQQSHFVGAPNSLNSTSADAHHSDPELVDVSYWAQSAGVRIPVHLTRAVWDHVIGSPKMQDDRHCDQNTRLKELLSQLRLIMHRVNSETTAFPVLLSDKDHSKDHSLKLYLSQDAGGETALTILMADTR